MLTRREVVVEARRGPRIRAALTATAAACVAAAASAGVSLADTPPGQGLVVVPFPFTCEGIGEVTVTGTPGNGPYATGSYWINGRHILVQEVTVIQNGVVVFH